MSQVDEVTEYLVGALGLDAHELRMVISILNLSSYYKKAHYKWVENADPAKVDVLFVNANDGWAMQLIDAHKTERNFPEILLICDKGQPASMGIAIARPVSPRNVMGPLELVAEKLQGKHADKSVVAFSEDLDPAEHVPSTSNAPSLHALVVDDSLTVRNQLKVELMEQGYLADLVETGEEGLAQLEKSAYDVIFLDVVLPGMDGYQVCKIIKKNPLSKQIPVVMLTRKSSPFDRIRGSLAGCDTYLTKPVDLAKFNQVLMNLKR